MTHEELDFAYFAQHQLCEVDFTTGRIDTHRRNNKGQVSGVMFNVGSVNQDGYVRLWCNGTLRMKHRLLYWLFHGELPKEIDHWDTQRANNAISNLRPSDRSHNTKGKTPRTFKWLTETEVHELCKLIAAGTHTITDLAKQFGRSRVQIKAIMGKKSWKAIADQYF